MVVFQATKLRLFWVVSPAELADSERAHTAFGICRSTRRVDPREFVAGSLDECIASRHEPPRVRGIAFVLGSIIP
jgi:hypothetical protein